MSAGSNLTGTVGGERSPGLLCLVDLDRLDDGGRRPDLCGRTGWCLLSRLDEVLLLRRCLRRCLRVGELLCVTRLRRRCVRLRRE